MEAIKVMASIDDKLDRLLVSFKDAKVRHPNFMKTQLSLFLQIALLEWSDTLHDLVTVSIHTYERAPQLVDPLTAAHSFLLTDSLDVYGLDGFSLRTSCGSSISLCCLGLASGCHCNSTILPDPGRD